ncbi:MAG: methylisocitrate lyase [Vampirovibrio sp.]|nr:methylisocitrate lyase [Vampirovibrio sp.]
MPNPTNRFQEPLLNPTPDKPAQLRRLLADGKTLMLPGAFNAICAKIIENLGYPAVYISGAGLANGVGGYPDIGMLSMAEAVQQSGYIAQAVNIPAIADADTGFGEAIQVFRTVQAMEQAGLSGIHIEDQVFPKRCGHLQGKQLISTEAMTEKLSTAVAARKNPDFLLIARTDAKAVDGLDAAIDRACRYVDAGADMIFAEAMTSPQDFEAFAQGVRKRHPHIMLLANMTEFGKTPYLNVQEFEQLGYNIVIFPLSAFRVMMKSVEEALAKLKADGGQTAILEQMTTRQDLYKLIHYEEYEALDQSIAGYQ